MLLEILAVMSSVKRKSLKKYMYVLFFGMFVFGSVWQRCVCNEVDRNCQEHAAVSHPLH